MRTWLKGLLIGLGSIVFIYVLFMVTYFATTTPRFCSSCHEVAPYVASWRHSAHKSVNCLYCHEPRGALGKLHSKSRGLNYVYRHIAGQYTSIVETEIFDQNCIDCHFGNYTKYPKAKKPTKKHYALMKNKRRCSECHRNTAHDTTIGLEKFFK